MEFLDLQKTKRQLRAEAVERLRSALQGMREAMNSCRKTETQGWDTYWITADGFDKMFRELQDCADLLADDEPPEEIVRCRDCEFGAYDGEECMRIDEWDGDLWFPVEPDGFCKWGERRDA